MKRERLREMFVRGVRQLMDPYYQGFAAQIAFFLLLSLVPTFILLTQLLGIMSISIDFIEEWIDEYVKSSMGQTLKNLIASRSTVSNDILLFLTALWSSSRAQFALMRIANYTYTGGRFTGNYFKERVRSLKTMLLLVITLAFVVFALVYGKRILVLLFGNIVDLKLLIRLWTILRWPIAFVLYLLVVLYEYVVLPRNRKPPEEVAPGAIFAAVGMLLVTMLYSFYSNYIVDYGIVYGSLATIVALLFWFFFLSWVLVIGIVFNKVWEDTKKKESEYQ